MLSALTEVSTWSDILELNSEYVCFIELGYRRNVKVQLFEHVHSSEISKALKTKRRVSV